MKLESLERRRLLSVSVVEGYPGYFDIHGTDEAEAISIEVSNDTRTFTLDGVTYGGVEYVSVFAYGGDDVVSVAIRGDGPIAAAIVAGTGNDDVSLTGAGAIWGDHGDDTLRLADSFRGEIYGGSGEDKLYISGPCADAVIEGEQGADLIDASASAYGVFASGGTGADTVFGSNFDDQLYGDGGCDLLVGNAGDDVFYTADYEYDRIIGGAGIDVAYADMGEGTWGVEYVFYI